jgi:hypothetical protein
MILFAVHIFPRRLHLIIYCWHVDYDIRMTSVYLISIILPPVFLSIISFMRLIYCIPKLFNYAQRDSMKDTPEIVENNEKFNASCQFQFSLAIV